MERILLHLFDYGRFEDRDEAPAEVTQKGIAEAVGIRTRRVPRYVKPLQANAFVEEGTSRVQGIPRRWKVYFLTASGRDRAASIRRSLLKKTVTFTRMTGEVKEASLSAVFQENQLGPRLSELIGQLTSKEAIAEATPPVRPELVDYAREAPPVENLYGREEEMRRVRRAVAEAPLVVVTGAPGMGKSALGARVCDELGGERSLCWRRIRPWDTSMDLALGLAGFLGALGQAELHHYLTTPGPKELSRIGALLASDFSGVRCLLIFDDVHTASEEARFFLSILYDVLKRGGESSALLLSRTVPDFYSRKDVEIDRSVAEVPLGSLDAGSARSFLLDAGVSDDRVDAIVEFSGGSPLFLKVLSRVSEPEGIKSGRSTLEAYIAEEIEADLTDHERYILEISSFYEVPISRGGLLLGKKGGTKTLVSLQKKGLLDQVDVDRFALHDFLRSYFQDGLPSSRRAEHVNQIVPWLHETAVRVVAEVLPPQANPLMYWPREVDLTYRTGLQRAISLLETAVMIDHRPARRAQGYEWLGRIRQTVGDEAGSAEANRKALRDAPDDPFRIRIHKQLATTSHFTDEEGERNIAAGLDLLPPGPSVEAADFLLERAERAMIAGQLEQAWKVIEQVGGWRDALPRDDPIQGSLSLLRGVLLMLHPRRQDLDQAEAELREAERIHLALDDLTALGWVYQDMTVAALLKNRFGEALAHVDNLLALAVEISDPAARVVGMGLMGHILSDYIGEFEAAEKLFGEAEDLALQLELPWRDVIQALRASALEHQGRFEDAQGALGHYLDQFPFAWLSEQLDPITANAWAARLCLRRQDRGGAATYFQRVKDLVEKHPSDAAQKALKWAEEAMLASQNEEGDTKLLMVLEDPNAYQIRLEVAHTSSHWLGLHRPHS